MNECRRLISAPNTANRLHRTVSYQLAAAIASKQTRCTKYLLGVHKGPARFPFQLPACAEFAEGTISGGIYKGLFVEIRYRLNYLSFRGWIFTARPLAHVDL